MRLGLSSASFFPEVYTEDSISIMNGLGFSCGEIFLNTESEYEQPFIEKINEQKEKNGFDVISVHSFSGAFEPYLFDRYERRRKDLFKLYSKVCKAASLLGAKYYTFHGVKEVEFTAERMKQVTDIYDELVYIALENGIQLAQENVSWCMSNNPDFISLLAEKCKYPIKFTLDIKQAYKAGRDPEAYMKVMKDRLENIHINDRTEQQVCLLPGDGDVDYSKFFAQLEKYGYNGDLIIEIYRENFKSTADIVKSAQFINEFINK